MEINNICAIILDYFGSQKTITCLTSLLDQGLDTVMIVDNSGNRQANIQLQEALTKFNQQGLPFKIHQIVNPHNLGYARGVNEAIRWLENHKPHQYYLLINNDTEAAPGMLSYLLKFMQENKRVALTAPVIDVGHQQLTGYWYHRLTGLMFSHPVIGTFYYLSGCCLLANRKIIGAGLLDEDFFMYGEDVELCHRLRRLDWNIACVSQAKVLHEGTGSSRQGNFFYEYHVLRGHMILARKLVERPGEILPLYLGRLLALSLRSIVRAIRYKSWIPVKAWISVLRNNFNK